MLQLAVKVPIKVELLRLYLHDWCSCQLAIQKFEHPGMLQVMNLLELAVLASHVI